MPHRSAGAKTSCPTVGSKPILPGNDAALATVTEKGLRSSLEEALRGEVDPKTLRIKVTRPTDQPEALFISIKYQLSAIGQADEVVIGSVDQGG